MINSYSYFSTHSILSPHTLTISRKPKNFNEEFGRLLCLCWWRFVLNNPRWTDDQYALHFRWPSSARWRSPSSDLYLRFDYVSSPLCSLQCPHLVWHSSSSCRPNLPPSVGFRSQLSAAIIVPYVMLSSSIFWVERCFCAVADHRHRRRPSLPSPLLCS